MKRYLLQRFIAMVLALWVIITLTFILMHLAPGDPFEKERSSNEVVMQNIRAYYQLDQPYMIQYFSYLRSILTLDFGPSLVKDTQTVNQMLASGFPVSLELGFWALLVATITGITLGVIAALRHNRLLDYGAMVVAVIGISVPNFIMAALLKKYLAVEWNLLPVATWGTQLHIVLPALALTFGPLAIIARLTRSNMLEVLTQDYIRTARAKGLHPVVIVLKHALRNALLPVVTLLGALIPGILTGSFVIEKIFAVPGIGGYFVESINNRDYPTIMGTTVLYSSFFILMMLVVDLAYSLLDPRIRLDQKGE